jgi:ElaB/YqjD/DUF883 family membrane-anchored ribosome-binding protein
MRTLRMAILMGIAGLIWKALKPKLPAAKAQLANARDRIEPALRDATNRVRSASKDGAKSVRDASLSVAEAADSVVHVVADPATAESGALQGS